MNEPNKPNDMIFKVIQGQGQGYRAFEYLTFSWLFFIRLQQRWPHSRTGVILSIVICVNAHEFLSSWNKVYHHHLPCYVFCKMSTMHYLINFSHLCSNRFLPARSAGRAPRSFSNLWICLKPSCRPQLPRGEFLIYLFTCDEIIEWFPREPLRSFETISFC